MAPDPMLGGNPPFLTLQHSQRVRTSISTDKGTTKLEAVSLPPAGVHAPRKGYEQLYSYFRPALVGGTYKIKAVQTVTSDGQMLEPVPTSYKKFKVQSPQYILPEGAVHSVFPPSGSKVQAQTLAHILFADSYLLWERLIEGEGNGFERAPWLALLVFSEEELVLNEQVLDPTSSLLKGTNLAEIARNDKTKIQQGPTLAIKTLISDMPRNHEKLKTKIPYAKDIRGDVIFITPLLFELLTTDYTPDGKPDTSQDAASVARYKYLAHVRYSNAEGMEANGDHGLYAVVHSHRIGPLRTDKSSRTIVHLVSLEDLSGWTRSDVSGSDYIVLSWLYSWSYTTLSTGAMNVS